MSPFHSGVLVREIITMKLAGNPISILLRFLFLLQTEFFCFEVFAKVLKTLKYGQKCRINLNYLKTGLSIIFFMQFGRRIKGKQHKTRQFREGY